MSKKKKGQGKPINFVHKHMNKVCRAEAHRDKKNDYRRKDKHHKGYDAFFMTFVPIHSLTF